jgi:hypothetical protein
MQMGWMEFFNRKANLGLYYANHDSEPRQSALNPAFAVENYFERNSTSAVV